MVAPGAAASPQTGAGIVVGIDAANLRLGGGITHLQQMLAAARPQACGVARVIVWSGRALRDALPERDWLTKVHARLLDGRLPARAFWQQVLLPHAARRAGCDVLFSPSGVVPWRARMPRVTMSHNMLPWDPAQRRRYALASWMYWKLWLLRMLQGRSFRRADGVIFLTRYAREAIRALVPVARDALVPHGIEPRFFVPPRASRTQFTAAAPFRFLYVSMIHPYKNQERVAEAAALLRAAGEPLVIDFVGPPAYPPAVRRFGRRMAELDKRGEFLSWRGAMPFEELHRAYAEADGFVFASSCENLPIILLEAMAAGLPTACSKCGPMPEVLGDAGAYFDPEDAGDIARALHTLVADAALRTELGARAAARARGYSWSECADATLRFLAEVARSTRP